jgi:tetratricopeptide (TPR) repeat protein
LHRFPEAIEYAKKAMELNPFERPYGLAETYLNAGEYDVALAELQQRLEATPNDPMLLFLTMDAWRRKGNYQEAVDAWARFHVAVGEPRAAAALRRAYEQGGARGFVRWQLARRLKEAKSTYVSPVELAGYHAQLGEREQTLQLLEEAYQQRATDLLWIDVDPAYQFLQGNSRYQTLLHHIGVPMTAPAGL